MDRTSGAENPDAPLDADHAGRQRLEEDWLHLERVTALRDITLAITSTLDLRAVLDILAAKIVSFLPRSSGTIRLLNRKNGDLEPAVSWNLTAEELKALRGKNGGLCRAAFEANAPLVIQDVLADPRTQRRDVAAANQIFSYVGIALTAMDEKFGVLSFHTKGQRGFHRDEVEFLTTLAGHAAIAIYNAQLHDRVKRNFERTRALHEVGLAVTSNLDLSTVLNVLLDQAGRVIPHAAAEIRLLNEETGILEPTACRNLDADNWKSVRAGRGLAKIVLDTGAPLAVRQVQRDPRTANPEFMRREGIVSFLGVPLTVAGNAIGCFIVLTRDEHDFTGDESELFSTLASQAAIAIHNARLYERVKKQSADLAQANQDLKTRTLQQGVISLLGSLALARGDLGSLLEETVVLIAQTLRVEYAKVLELLDDSETLLLRAGVGWKDGLVGRATVKSGDLSQAGYTLKVREPVIVEDLATETRFSGPPLLLEHGVVSGVSVVIQGKERPYGVLGIHSTQARRFSLDDINFLQSVANLLATAVERQKSEDALAEQKTLLRTIIDTEPECVKLLDADGTVLEMNQAGLAMIEAPSTDVVLGKSVYPLIAPNYREKFAALTKAVFRGDSAILQFEIVGLKGAHRWVDTHAVPLRNQMGEIIAALSVTRDITERRAAEEALRKSEERFKIVARATNDAIWDWNLFTGHVWWNEGVTTLFRYPIDRLHFAIDWWQERVHPDDRERILSGVHAVIDGGQQTWRDEYRFLCGDGSYAFVVDRGFVIYENGRAVRMIGCMTDITESRQARAELESSHERLRALAGHLQAAREEERTRVAREIHDELGQALTGLKMDLSWLRKKLTKDQDALKEKADSMLALMDNTIRSVRRISTALRPGVLDDLGLAAAIEWQVQEFQNRTGIKCQLAAELDDGRLDRLRSTALFRICQETLTNIARHAHASRVKIRLQQKSGDVSLRVEDNGHGIPKSRLADPRSLGILGMRERALLLGGEVTIQSARGKGTTVTARIPADGHD